MTFASMPSKWSIASCLFPREENPTLPGPGPHPVLIAGVIPEKRLVLAAYGSGQTNVTLARALEPYQIEITQRTSYLKLTTRFDFRKAVPIEWSEEWFKPIGHNVPIIMGTLDRAQIIQASRAMKEWNDRLTAGAAPWGAAQIAVAPAHTAIPQKASPVIVVRQRRNYSAPGKSEE
ncbi:hypothetical protein ABIB38_002251 [Massilia sp. UYP11]|jgi:hypothetical protein|uniref:hypothetical protein n=1 Tax=Massilia sp. UYP11 TaxID=1756385 RepID=UPI003D25FADC